MSQSENEQKKKDIEEMKKRIPELRKFAFSNYYRILLKKWLVVIVAIVICFPLGVVIGQFLLSPSSLLGSSNLYDAAKTIIAPSITVYGFFVTALPVVSFFYLQEIKEKQREALEMLREERKRYKEKGELDIVNSVYDLTHTFWYNLRVGVLKYVRTYLVVGIIALFSIIYSYLVLGYAYTEIFIVIDICLLLVALSGIIPVIMVALSEPAKILVSYVVSQEIVEKIEYE